MTARARFAVRGRVQGVGFRWFVQDAARRLGLAGWVRNEPDGSVSAEAEGPRDVVERLIAATRSGPPGARVTTVAVDWIEPRGEPDGTFAIRR